MDMTRYSPIGAIVARRAAELGWPLAEVARRLGWSPQRLGHWLRRESLKVADLRAVASVMGLDAVTLAACDARREA